MTLIIHVKPYTNRINSYVPRPGSGGTRTPGVSGGTLAPSPWEEAGERLRVSSLHLRPEKKSYNQQNVSLFQLVNIFTKIIIILHRE